MSGAVHVPAGWFEVGASDEPDRRRHWAHFAACAAGIGSPPALFVTLGMARPMMASGQWLEARRHDGRLRSPDDVIGEGCDGPDHPLEGLLAMEAETLVQLLGGRLAREKELDRFVSANPAWRLATDPWSAWTASNWSLLAYSLNRWNPSSQRWESPGQSRFPAAGDAARSVLRWDGRRLSRLSCDPGQGSGMRAAAVFDV